MRRGRVWGLERMLIDRAEQESAIVKAFILPERRARFLEVASTRKIKRKGSLTPRELKRDGKYRQMLANLEHWFDPRCKQFLITANDQHSEAKSKLAKLGASGDAYVMSEDHMIDGRTMDTEEIFSCLARSHAYGTLVVWLEHEAAYYEQPELASLTRVLLSGHGS